MPSNNQQRSCKPTAVEIFLRVVRKGEWVHCVCGVTERKWLQASGRNRQFTDQTCLFNPQSEKLVATIFGFGNAILVCLASWDFSSYAIPAAVNLQGLKYWTHWPQWDRMKWWTCKHEKMVVNKMPNFTMGYDLQTNVASKRRHWPPKRLRPCIRERRFVQFHSGYGFWNWNVQAFGDLTSWVCPNAQQY